MFNELALQRFDLILAEAARNGIYVIFPMVDGDAYLGGPEWYYEQATPAVMLSAPVATYDAWKLASHAEPSHRNTLLLKEAKRGNGLHSRAPVDVSGDRTPQEEENAIHALA